MKRMALLFALAFAIITLGCSGETNKETPVDGDKRSGAKMDVSGACFRDSVGICHFPVIVNDNFDNVNSKRNVPVRDYAAKGGYVDNDLVPIVIGVKDGVARSVTLTDKTDDLCLGGACARGVVRFWADKQKREEITLPKAFKGDEMPKTIYAEGLSAGGVSSYLLTADKDDRSSIVFATNTIELTTTTELTVSDSDGRKVPTGWKNLDAGIVFKLHGWVQTNY